MFKKVDCKCKGNYTYNCAKQYCSIDKDACDEDDDGDINDFVEDRDMFLGLSSLTQ